MPESLEDRLLKAVRYRSLDEARAVLLEALGRVPPIFDDAGDEPQGLLSVVPEDRLSEEEFIRLFNVEKGVLVEVEKIAYRGLGPPAEEDDYMGYLSEQVAYVLRGRRLPIEITSCPFGARDFHELDFLVWEGKHPVDREDLARRLSLPEDWDFDDLFEMIAEGHCDAEEIDRAIHAGLQPGR